MCFVLISLFSDVFWINKDFLFFHFISTGAVLVISFALFIFLVVGLEVIICIQLIIDGLAIMSFLI